MSASPRPLKIALFGLSITSSWGNGHATTYRSLVKGLVQRGHEVVFYERRQRWYEENRDLRRSSLCEIVLYDSYEDLAHRLGSELQDADLVIIGSYVSDAIRIARRVLGHSRAVTAFYDIDTPVTLASLDAGTCGYLVPDLIPQFDLYLSFSGGPILETLERKYGARRAVPFYCSVDAEQYFPLRIQQIFDLAYLGTYSADRQPKLESLLNEAARRWPEGRFGVAGAQYPDTIRWPENVARADHIAPLEHGRFYNSQRFTLNLTRRDMVASGFSPSVRLFEAAACGVPVISDDWNGLSSFFVPDQEILVASTTEDVLRVLREISPEEARCIGSRARSRVLREHTSEHRAHELERYVEQCRAPAIRERSIDAGVTRPSSAIVH
jgi:spore maturation protein CgeB